MDNFITEDKNTFILKIQELFDIEYSIIECCLELNILENLFFLSNSKLKFYVSNSNRYMIPFELQIKPNFKNLITYYLALFVLKNKNVSIFKTDPNLTLVVYNKDIYINCQIFESDKYGDFFEIFHKFSLKKFVNYNLKLLNKTEKSNLIYFVKNKLNRNYFYEDYISHKKYFYNDVVISIDLESSLENNIKKLESYITTSKVLYELSVNDIKQQTDDFFKRGLLDSEMNSF